MSSSPKTLQVCRDCGGGAPIDAHFCPQCTKILSLGRHGDYFAFMGLPRQLNLDGAELERRFRTLSRQFHPDFFYNATTAERRASLERSSYLNDAYRTLRDPIARMQYLLQIEGLASSGPAEATTQVPPGLLEGVFAPHKVSDIEPEDRCDLLGVPRSNYRGELQIIQPPGAVIIHYAWNHAFRGTVRGDRIEGKVTISNSENSRTIPWLATRSR